MGLDEDTLDGYLDYVYSRELEDVEEALVGVEADLRDYCCDECRRIRRPFLIMERGALRRRRDRLKKYL